MKFWRKKVAKKEAKEDAPKASAPAKPVIAIEYDGTLYPSFQRAEGARAKSDLMTILDPPSSTSHLDHYSCFVRNGKQQAIDSVLENAERVHAILSRYLDAAKIELPTAVR